MFIGSPDQTQRARETLERVVKMEWADIRAKISMNQNFNQPNLDNLSVKSNSKLNGYLKIFWKKVRNQTITKNHSKEPTFFFLSPVRESQNKREFWFPTKFRKGGKPE
jgi:hypothetical protein